MQEPAFDPARVRGLGLLKAPPTPPPAPARDPEGLGQGQWRRLPHGVGVLSAAPAGCKHWLLAFVSGAPRPNVLVSGYGFSYQKLIDHFAAKAGNSTTYFTFSNNRGHYMFAYEIERGRRVLKVCTDGMKIARTSHRAAWTVIPKGHRGLGALFTNVPGPGIKLLNAAQSKLAASWSWMQIYPTDVSGLTSVSSIGGHLSGILTALSSAVSDPSGSGATSINGYTYFAYIDQASNATTTPGEPAGVSILRYHVGPSGPAIGICNAESAPAPAPVPGPGPAPVSTAAQIPIYTPPTSMEVGPPTAPGLWWWRYQWVYQGGGGLPSMPPSNLAPPGANLAAAGAANPNVGVGTWISHGGSRSTWFPTGQLVQLLGGDNQLYWVYSSRLVNSGQQDPNFTGSALSGPPPALAGTSGQWVNPVPGYYVWVPSVGLATTTTDYTWLWVLLGLVGVGGAAYLILD